MLAETTGDFMLLDLSVGQTLPASRPSVVEPTAFINARIALSQIVKVADVPDEATDDEFAQYWVDSDGNRDLAVSSFLSKFDGEEKAAPAPRKRTAK